MIKGDRYNKLIAIKFIKKDIKRNKYWLFRCDCGKEKVINISSVRNNYTKSCGCIAAKGNNKTHGMTDSKIYHIWCGLRQRCLNKNSHKYRIYGARGIKVCERWNKFENFYADMGDVPKGKTLDRIDNNGNYCKENCNWATPKEQANNTRVNHLLTHKGETKTISEWADKTGIDYQIIWKRIYRKWTIERTLNLKNK